MSCWYCCASPELLGELDDLLRPPGHVGRIKRRSIALRVGWPCAKPNDKAMKPDWIGLRIAVSSLDAGGAGQATAERHCRRKCGSQAAGSGPTSAMSRSIRRTVLARPDSTATRSSRPDRSSSQATEALPCLSRKRRPPTVRSSRIGQIFRLGQLQAVAVVDRVGTGVGQQDLGRALLDDGVRDRAAQGVGGRLRGQDHQAVELADGLELVVDQVAEAGIEQCFPELVDREHQATAVEQALDRGGKGTTRSGRASPGRPARRSRRSPGRARPAKRASASLSSTQPSAPPLHHLSSLAPGPSGSDWPEEGAQFAERPGLRRQRQHGAHAQLEPALLLRLQVLPGRVDQRLDQLP